MLQFHFFTFGWKGKIFPHVTVNFDLWPRPTKMTKIGSGWWTTTPNIQVKDYFVRTHTAYRLHCSDHRVADYNTLFWRHVLKQDLIIAFKKVSACSKQKVEGAGLFSRIVFKDQLRTIQGKFGSHGKRGARAYNEILRAEPPVGIRGWSPLKLKAFLHFACPNKAANLPHDWYLTKSLNHTVNERFVV